MLFGFGLDWIGFGFKPAFEAQLFGLERGGFGKGGKGDEEGVREKDW